MHSDLETLLPEPKEVKIGEEVFSIKPFEWGQFQAVLSVTKSLELVLDENNEINILGTISAYGKEITDIIAMVTGRDEKWVLGLSLISVVELATAIFMVNRDFFTQRLLPVLQQSVESLRDGQK